ncbi:hypothetical protein D3C85_1684120 [compost metagenome]
MSTDSSLHNLFPFLDDIPEQYRPDEPIEQLEYGRWRAAPLGRPAGSRAQSHLFEH